LADIQAALDFRLATAAPGKIVVMMSCWQWSPEWNGLWAAIQAAGPSQHTS